MILVRDDVHVRYAYFRLIEECVAKIVLSKDGRDPDFECGAKIDMDVEGLLSK